jgi:glycolate oxidase iron-sulfur subunit
MEQNIFNFNEISEFCIKCGKCIPECTVYRINPDETTSPRGFLDLLAGIQNGELELDKNAKDIFESCFLCSNCTQVCPNSLQTDFAIENVRKEIADKYGITWFKRVFFYLLRHRWAFDIVAKLGYMFQTCGFKIEQEKNAMRSRFSLPLIKRGRLLPSMKKTSFLNKYPAHIPSVEAPQKRVAIFIGCLANYNFTEVGDALIKILKHLNVDVIIPKKQMCCAAPAYFTGDFATTDRLAKYNMEYFDSFIDDVDAIIVPEATCHAMLKVDYEHYFRHYAPEYLELHSKIKDKLFGATEWLYKETNLKDILDKKSKSNTKVTYHDPCHFRKVQGIYKEPRALLEQYTFVEMSDPNVCCGFGGITIQTEKFHLAQKAGKIKADMIDETKANFVSAECSACRIQLTEALNANKSEVNFKHPLELIAQLLDD